MIHNNQMSTRYKYWFLLDVGFDAVDGFVGLDSSLEMGSSRLDELTAATVAKVDSLVADIMKTCW